MSTTPVVLVVDDEPSLRDFLRRTLETYGYDVLTAIDGIDALSVIKHQTVDLVLLDILMPRLDGLETIQRIRQTSLVPIIIVSGMGGEAEKVRAFNLGADDYLLKPFTIGELLGRLKAILRRARWAETSPARDETIACGEIVADLVRYRVTVRENPIDLARTEFNLLVFLMRNAGRVLPHRSILQQVWGPGYGSEAEYLRVYVGKLRHKIESDPLNPRHIITERGVGYLFN